MNVTDALFQHVRDCGLEVRCLRDIPGYSDAARQREPLLDALAAALPPEGQALLEQYLWAEGEMAFAEELALFRCGLTVGLTLGSMGR